MKFGMRKPSIKKSFKARTTGRIKRSVKRSINPLYGKKGMGLINNPKKSVYNNFYKKTTVGLKDILTVKNNKTKKENIEIEINEKNISKLSESEKSIIFHEIAVKYQDFHQEYYSNMEKAKEYYSLFINNNLDKEYFKKMLDYCNKVFESEELARSIEKINNELVGTKDAVAHGNDAYIVLAKSYEKLKEYDKAIKICETAIKHNFENDGTKYGFKGRIERLNKKINK